MNRNIWSIKKYALLKKIILSFLLCAITITAICQQKGKASYYSKRATGARTSSGVRMHHDSLVCAHRTFPFGTQLLVKNLSNGKSVVVKVIDRGPHTRGRIIDLSLEAARQLGMVQQGVALVEVTEYEKDYGVPYPAAPIHIPEIDFESIDPDSVPRIDPLHPQWNVSNEKDSQQTQPKMPDAKFTQK